MDPKGKVVVVTGASSGLGQAFAIDIAKAGAKVFVVGRDAQRLAETKAQAGGDTEVVVGDVSTKAGAQAVADAVLAKTDRVDVLVNNAGGQWKTMSKTPEGVETTFAVNVLGAYRLERMLHPALARAKGRVVNLVTGFLDSFAVDPEQLVEPKPYKSMGVYARAKHAGVMMSVEQARRFAGDGITVEALHPGVIMGTRFGGGQPKLAQAIGGPIMRAIGFACTLEEAVRRFRVAAFDELPSGSYLVKGKVAPLPKQSNDAAVREKVMSVIDRLSA